MKETNYELYDGINTDQKDEHLFWVPIEELDNINLVPAFLKTAVKSIQMELRGLYHRSSFTF